MRSYNLRCVLSAALLFLAATAHAQTLIAQQDGGITVSETDVRIELDSMPENLRGRAEGNPQHLGEIIGDIYRRKVLSALSVSQGLDRSQKVEQERRTALEERKRKEAEARKNEDPDAILAQLQMV